MAKEKAYKLLALQEGISNGEAKKLIDRGLVYLLGKRVKIARGEVDAASRFNVKKVDVPKTIFEDDKIVALNKPSFVNSEELLNIERFKECKLLHRLDRESSGVILLTKDEEFRQKAILEFKEMNVYKEYVAWVDGSVALPFIVDDPLIITKGNKARVKIGKDGVSALSEVYPLEIFGKFSKVKIIIKTGRTHQIRVHMQSKNHPLLGDELYGGKSHFRIMLHSKVLKIFDYTFEAPEPKEFILS